MLMILKQCMCSYHRLKTVYASDTNHILIYALVSARFNLLFWAQLIKLFYVHVYSTCVQLLLVEIG